MACKSFFTLIDFYPNIVGLRYSGHWRFATTVGGILSIITLIGTFSVVGYFGYIYFTPLESKRTSYEESRQFKSNALNLTSGVTLALLTRFDNNAYFDQKAYSLNLRHISVDKSTGYREVKNITSSLCKRELFLKTILPEQNQTMWNDFNNLSLDQAYCINTKDLAIEGSEVNNHYSYLDIALDFCAAVNDNPKANCYSEEEFVNLFKTQVITANIYYLDTAYNAVQYPHVYFNYINEIKVKLTSQNAKETNVFFSNNSLEIEDGYIVTQKRSWYDIMISQVDYFISVRTPNDRTSISFKFYSSPKSTKIKITFMTFSEFLANIGGILTNFFTIAQIVMYFTNNLTFEKDLIETLFRFEVDKNEPVFKNRRDRLIIRGTKMETNLKEILELRNLKSPEKLMTDLKQKDEEYGREMSKRNELSEVPDLYEDVKLHHVKRNLNTKKSKGSGLSERPLTSETNLVEDIKDNNNILSLASKITPKNRLKTVIFKESKNQVGYKEILSDPNENHGEIKFNPRDYYKLYFCGRCYKSKNMKDKFNAFNHIIEVLNYMYDYSRFYNTILELELLKYLLLDEEELYLFNFNPPPRIFDPEILNKKRNKDSSIKISFKGFSEYYNSKLNVVGDSNLWYTKDENFNQFLKVIESVKNRRPKSELDRKLLENFT